MKKILAVTLGCFTLTFASITLAGCSSSSCNSCGRTVSCQAQPISACNCSDPGLGRNSCMTNKKYCEAFGNIAGIKDSSF